MPSCERRRGSVLTKFRPMCNEIRFRPPAGRGLFSHRAGRQLREGLPSAHVTEAAGALRLPALGLPWMAVSS